MPSREDTIARNWKASNAGYSSSRAKSKPNPTSNDQRLINQHSDNNGRDDNNGLTEQEFYNYSYKVRGDTTPANLARAIQDDRLNLEDLIEFYTLTVQQFRAANSDTHQSLLVGNFDDGSLDKDHAIFGDHGDSQLKVIHSTVPMLFMDSYLDTAQPAPPLVSIFKDMGFYPGDWEVDFLGYRKMLCDEGNTVYTPVIVPKTSSGSVNPYIRYKYSKSSGAQAYQKLDNSLGNSYVSSLVLTFPNCVSKAYANSINSSDWWIVKQGLPAPIKDTHQAIERKAWKAKQMFHHKLESIKCDSGMHLASSDTLHTWSSSNPTKPHLHFHSIIPLFKAPYLWSKDRASISTETLLHLKERNSFNLPDKMESEVSDVIRNKGNSVANLPAGIHASDALRSAALEDKDFAYVINRVMEDKIGIESLDWVGIEFFYSDTSNFWITKQGLPAPTYKKRMPFDHNMIKELWTECVKKSFPNYNITESTNKLDVNLKYSNNKSKILHWLSYKSRPPVVDLNKFFSSKSHSDTLTSDELNRMGFIEHLINANANTRVYGFWKTLTNFKKPSYTAFEKVCNICGHNIHDTGEIVIDLPRNTLTYYENSEGYIITHKKAPPDNRKKNPDNSKSLETQVLDSAIYETNDKSELMDKYGDAVIETLLHEGVLFESRPNFIKKV